MTDLLRRIFLNTLPVIVMIGTIPFVKNDIMLTVMYIAIILLSFLVRYENKDYVYFLFGFIGITLSELFFVSTGVEFFVRTSLFGLIPFWLPFLWAYAFVVIKRCIIIINNYHQL